MDNKTGAERYHNFAIFLHWLLAIGVFVMIGLGWYMTDIPKGTPDRAFWFNLHKSIGVTLGVLVLIRLWWRLTHKPPALPASMPAWEVTAAKISHTLLYACLVIMPVVGFLGSNFTKYGVKYFGIPIGPFFAENQARARCTGGSARDHLVRAGRRDRRSHPGGVQASGPRQGPRLRAHAAGPIATLRARLAARWQPSISGCRRRSREDHDVIGLPAALRWLARSDGHDGWAPATSTSDPLGRRSAYRMSAPRKALLSTCACSAAGIVVHDIVRTQQHVHQQRPRRVCRRAVRERDLAGQARPARARPGSAAVMRPGTSLPWPTKSATKRLLGR